MERSNRETLKTAAREQSLCVKSCFVGQCAIEGSGKDTRMCACKGKIYGCKDCQVTGCFVVVLIRMKLYGLNILLK